MNQQPTPTRTTRRQRQRQALISEILDLARAQMRAEGAAALNLNEIARQVGIRTPSLYEYFPGGKHAIYDALFAEGFTRFSTMMSAVEPADDPWQFLQKHMEQYLMFATTYPELYQLCFERPVPGFEPSAESMRISLNALANVRPIIEQFVAGLANPPALPIEHVRDLIIALMHGIAAQHLANEPHLPPGTGRFGSLIPAAVATLRQAWSTSPLSTETEGGDTE
jgi:AcrR family transcriptional regulator